MGHSVGLSAAILVFLVPASLSVVHHPHLLPPEHGKYCAGLAQPAIATPHAAFAPAGACNFATFAIAWQYTPLVRAEGEADVAAGVPRSKNQRALREQVTALANAGVRHKDIAELLSISKSLVYAVLPRVPSAVEQVSAAAAWAARAAAAAAGASAFEQAVAAGEAADATREQFFAAQSDIVHESETGNRANFANAWQYTPPARAAGAGNLGHQAVLWWIQELFRARRAVETTTTTTTTQEMHGSQHASSRSTPSIGCRHDRLTFSVFAK